MPGLRREVGFDLAGRWQTNFPRLKVGHVMWTLDKHAVGREPNDGSASPTLIIIPLGLLSLLVLGAADVHRDLLIAAIFTVGEYGIEPHFVGP